MCNSVLLTLAATGEVRRYCFATGSMDVLPTHPLVQIAENPAPALGGDDANQVGNTTASDGDVVAQAYSAKSMKLSVRNFLVRHPNKLSILQ